MGLVLEASITSFKGHRLTTLMDRQKKIIIAAVAAAGAVIIAVMAIFVGGGDDPAPTNSGPDSSQTAPAIDQPRADLVTNPADGAVSINADQVPATSPGSDTDYASECSTPTAGAPLFSVAIMGIDGFSNHGSTEIAGERATTDFVELATNHRLSVSQFGQERDVVSENMAFFHEDDRLVDRQSSTYDSLPGIAQVDWGWWTADGPDPQEMVFLATIKDAPGSCLLGTIDINPDPENPDPGSLGPTSSRAEMEKTLDVFLTSVNTNLNPPDPA